jgi:hypothetical protein
VAGASRVWELRLLESGLGLRCTRCLNVCLSPQAAVDPKEGPGSVSVYKLIVFYFISLLQGSGNIKCSLLVPLPPVTGISPWGPSSLSTLYLDASVPAPPFYVPRRPL